MESYSPLAQVVDLVVSDRGGGSLLKNKGRVLKGSKGEPMVRSTDPASFESASTWVRLTCYFAYFMHDLVFGQGAKGKREEDREGYAPLFASFESFYTRHMFRRFKDVAFQPICSVPEPDFKILDKSTECINLGSYNYLGFSENTGVCTEGAIGEIRASGLTHSSPPQEYGTHGTQRELEEVVARFLGVEDAVTFGMGYGTNTLNLPALFNSSTLVLSDSLNHASLILGLRLSGATVKVFKHNDIVDLEKRLREALVKGHPKTRRPWKKAVIVVEGVYSMEGSIVNLPGVLALKKKYGAYIYLDEAHSVGAMGPNGRGVVDYFNMDPKDIDVLMGTFTKSFGAAGGYISGSKRLIDYLRVNSHAQIYSSSISPPSMKCIMREPGYPDGLVRVQTLAKNSRYFRRKLHQMGFIIYGHNDSPVVPLLLFNPSKIRAFVYEMRQRKVATVTESRREGYSPLYASFESFYTRNVFRRLKDSFSHPIASAPGATVKIIGRSSDDYFWSFKMLRSQVKTCINLGSYNYLGFAENSGPCTSASIEELRERGLSSSSPRTEFGTSAIHMELERTVSQFIGSEDALTFGMGFATNTLNIPSIIGGRKSLVLSDEFNHASIILGLRLSGATVMVFKHNNVENLERILRSAIIRGHPRTRRPWKKILIVVEGVYSMEGTIVRLPEILALKKKYGAYLYLDEAHSVGAMGPNGRGVVDYFNLDPKDIDILMGTFTKSFGPRGAILRAQRDLSTTFECTPRPNFIPPPYHPQSPGKS
ncbi:Serine palmitoyltransferase 2like [Caligus rogercresseyi]|uniref:serine C-palmitoyltransferase n=1 Tax=Caligus rogercresseyi TaxID=217165 RepID=A0A7T8GNZ9_CALRO|nr:Serine palmitoyltransferase 2like [Caligus rogercresseyi]